MTYHKWTQVRASGRNWDRASDDFGSVESSNFSNNFSQKQQKGWISSAKLLFSKIRIARPFFIFRAKERTILRRGKMKERC